MILLDPLARPVIAHRGASGSSPENTLLAFQKAVDLGADAVELDVRLTRDGVPVVIHDPTLERTTNGRGSVRETPLERLRQFDAGAGERVPTLAEVLDLLDPVPVIIEIKERNAAQPVVSDIRAAAAERRVLIGSYDGRALVPARQAGIPTAASRLETGVAWVASRVRWGAIPRPFLGFSVPEYSGRIRVVDARFVAGARRTGTPVHVWTVDDIATAERLRRLGVAGIMTNFPERMSGLGC